MRVLHVIAGAAAGGAETFSLDAIAALAERGVVQKVVCRPHRQAVARLTELSIPFETYGFATAARLLGGPAMVRRQAATWRADLVHAWMSRAASFVPAGMPCPVIGWLGGYYNLKYFKTADYLVGVTPRIRDYLIAHAIPPDRALVCHTFGTLPDSPPVSRQALGVPEGALLLLVLSRLHWKKGIDTAIRALGDLPEAHLCLAGEGPGRGEYERLAGRLGWPERVHFLGWRSDRRSLLDACDICLLPSRYEPFGTVIAEAWSMRRPLVAALADGARQYVRDGDNGVLFPVDDAAALADCIRRIAGDPALAARLAENGHRDYRANFTRDVVTGNLLAIYRRIAGGAPVA
ncbi:MAG TPA: glycosyltransferase family 4 protein [Stellaceae bacterium]|nr:glycosyltransferase family 4 protein [Stellaceae bacterium]